MKTLKKAMFYLSAVSLMSWVMSQSQTLCNMIGALVLIAMLRLMVPILLVNYRLWNVNPKAEIAIMPKKGQRRGRLLFISVSAGILMASFNEQVFVPLGVGIAVLLGILYLPIVARGTIWEEETIEFKEGGLWRA